MNYPLGVAIVGCGNIGNAYANELAGYDETRVVGVFDVRDDARQAFADTHGIRAYDTLDELLADPEVAIVINLTAHFAHFEVSRAALAAGKHVYSEKPLAMRSDEARELIELAGQHGVRLAGSPSVWLGPASQTAWQQVHAGELGTVRAVYANADHGRIERWHPSPAGFYEAGPLFDVGVYPIALLTVIHGPVRRVSAVSRTLLSPRTAKDGSTFEPGSPDFTVAVLTMADGAVVRLTCSFYVNGAATVGEGVEFHGDKGSLVLSSWVAPRARVRRAEFAGEFDDVKLLDGEGGDDVEWSRGARDLARAIVEQRPHRASGEHAAHVVDVIDAIQRSSASHDEVSVDSAFPQPEPLGWSA